MARVVARVRPLAIPLAAYAASRVVTALAVGLAAFAAGKPVDRVLTTWDGRWYEKIANHGYPITVPHGEWSAGTGHRVQSEIAFFPLYPLLIRLVDPLVPGGASTAGVVVTLICGALATVAVWQLTAWVTDREVANRAAVLFCFSPGAFVLSLVYAEALMLALGAASLLALLQRRWVAAGVLAAFASATRPNAGAFAVACLWAAGAAVWQRREWRALIAPVLAPVGTIVFFAFLWWHTGEPGIWFRVQADGWGEEVDFGQRNLSVAWAFLRDPLEHPNRLVIGLSLALVLTCIGLLVKARLPGALNAYALTSLSLVLTSHINARPRFVFVAFPLVIALAKWARRSAFTVVAASFAATTVMLTIFYGLQRGSYYP
ncbi:MAG: mannosyltransferase family protein [Acidimicrobiia bacterium]